MRTAGEMVDLRKMNDEDAQQVATLIKTGFDESVRADVTAEGAAEFFRAVNEILFLKPTDHIIMIAATAGRPVGMIAIREVSHICLLFVAREFRNRGIARRLVESAASRCTSPESQHQTLTVNSSLSAVEAYKRLGFKQMQPKQMKNRIQFVPMMKS